MKRAFDVRLDRRKAQEAELGRKDRAFSDSGSFLSPVDRRAVLAATKLTAYALSIMLRTRADERAGDNPDRPSWQLIKAVSI